MSSPVWVGLFKIRDLLENIHSANQQWPPKANGVYIISKRLWRTKPNTNSEILYVGGNTGKSERFVTRIGDLMADLFGFYGGNTGHHSGGQSINKYCHENKIHPLNLFLGWKKYLISPESKSSAPSNCSRCQEVLLHADLSPKLNKNKPSKCKWHS